MKKIVFIVIFILGITTSVFATDVSVQINGEKINFTDANGQTVNAQIINDRTMVPMRKIFEVLGAKVEWDGENRIVTGTKDSISIKLQIDNTKAIKKINGVEKEIVLDSAPTIINDRTMVPLRFIAESLEKQVGWDAKNSTAIVINYSYFVNKLKNDTPALYSFLNSKAEYIEGNYTHKYYDLNEALNNTTFSLKVNARVDENFQDIALTIAGTSELNKEINKEGWNSTKFGLRYYDDKVLFSTVNPKLKDMFGIYDGQKYYKYDNLNLKGTYNFSLEKMFEVWAGVEDTSIDINTFNNLKNDFELLRGLFEVNINTTTEATLAASFIRYSTYGVKYFDLAKFDNFIFDNEYIKIFNVINKLIFKQEIDREVYLYDNKNSTINIAVKPNLIIITIVALNDYSEKNEYIFNFKNNY